MDLVDRDFARAAPNRLWFTDITEHRAREGEVYCAIVLDVHSRRVVGWSIDAGRTAALATNALGTAIVNRPPLSDTVNHSDHGVRAVHVMDFHQTCQGIRASAVDGIDRRLP